MTNINDISDLITVLNTSPEWRQAVQGALLGEEFSHLPEQLALYAEFTRRNFELVNRRLDRGEDDVAEVKTGQSRLEGDVAELKAGQSRLEAGQAALESDVAELKAGQSRLEAGQTVLEADVAELKAGQSRLEAGQTVLEADVAELKAGQSRLEAGQAALGASQNQLAGRMDRGFGMNYEYRVGKSIHSLANRDLALHQTRILYGARAVSEDRFLNTLSAARSGGLTDWDQISEILQLDLVLAARRQSDDSPLYVAAEISITINNSDIERAARRAAMLAAAVNQPVIPVAIGANIDQQRTDLAIQSGVTVIVHPED